MNTFLIFSKYLIEFSPVGVIQLNAEKQPMKIKANCLAQPKNRGAHGLKAQSTSS
jgi:hypothetical protein